VKAKEFLSQKGVPYEVKWVDRDRNAAIEMIRRSGQQGVPVIAIDSAGYVVQPGPALVSGVEALAWALHPDALAEPPPGRVARVG